MIAGKKLAAPLLLDLDGVLVDSDASQERAWRWWCESHGLPPEPFLHAQGRTGEAMIAALAPPRLAVRAREEATSVTDYEAGDAHDVRAYAGAAALLASPRPVAIVTSCRTPLARARLRAAGLAAPAVLVTADMVDCGKPHPAPYLLAAKQLNVEPERCVVIEDAPAGVQAAKEAGMYVVAVTSTVDATRLSAAHKIIPDLVTFLQTPI